MAVCRAIWELGRNPDSCGLIVSGAASQSVKILRQIKTNIEHNPRVHLVFPELRRERRYDWNPVWHEDAINVERSEHASFTEKDYSLQAVGVGGAILGARLDFVILDDVLNMLNTTTATMRKKIIDWYESTLVGRVRKDRPGKIWHIGTAWHEDDLSHYLEKKRAKVYKTMRVRAGEGDCRWPERYGGEKEYDDHLESLLEELGEVEYARQLLNEPIGESTEFFKMTKVRRCQQLCEDPRKWWFGLDAEERKLFSWTTAGVDMGFSATTTSALTAIFALGVLRADQTKHVLHVRSGRWEGVPLLEQVIEVWRLFGIRQFLFETNAGAKHVAAMIADHRILRALGVKRSELRGLRVSGQFTTQNNRNDVRWGIRGMAPEFDGEEWRIPAGRPEIEEWFSDLKVYTPWDHPGDRLVASWLAYIKLKGRGKPIAVKSRQIGAGV